MHRSSLCLHVHVAFSLCVSCLCARVSPLCKDASHWVRTTLMTLFILVTSVRTLFPNKVTFGVLGIRTSMYLFCRWIQFNQGLKAVDSVTLKLLTVFGEGPRLWNLQLSELLVGLLLFTDEETEVLKGEMLCQVANCLNPRPVGSLSHPTPPCWSC